MTDWEAELKSIKKLIVTDKQKALSCCLSALNVVEAETNKRLTAEFFHLTGLIYHEMEDYPSALSWYKNALELRVNENDKKGEATTLNNIGLVYSETGKYSDALQYLNQSINIKQDIGDKAGLTASYENIGEVFQKQLNYKSAIETFYKSLKISEEENDNSRMATTYQNIGSVHFAQGDTREALKMFEKALNLKNESDDFKQKVQLLNNIGVMLQEHNNTNEAIVYYNKCVEESIKHNYRAGLSAAHNNLGEIYLQQERLAEAESSFKACWELAEKSGNVAELMIAEMNLGETYLKQNRIQDAEKHLLTSLKYFSEASHEQGFFNLQKLLTLFYEKKNEPAKALSHFKIYDELKYRQLNTENSKIINELKTKYEVEKKEKENEIHRLRNVELKDALEDLTLEKRKSEKLLLNILPEAIAYELKRTGKVKAQSYESVSVLFADIKGFTHHSENLSPDAVVKLLDFYFQIFDTVIIDLGIEKIKTIGDAYLCVSGLPVETANHALSLAHAAILIRDKINEENALRKNNNLPVFEFRFGIHSGPVIAGIVGKAKFEFDIWGDTVNTAARMEQSGEPCKVNISGATYLFIKDKYQCTYRGKVEAKNKGTVDMYFVEREL